MVEGTRILGFLYSLYPATFEPNSIENRPIIISDADHQRLEALIESVRYNASLREDYLDALEGELKRARVVPQSDMPPEVITMNSVVRLRDLDSEETEEYELVYRS